MKHVHWLSLAALAFAALAASSRADHFGVPLPTFEAEGLTQTPAKSFDDFLGRAVLIEYFGCFGDPSEVPRLNELQDRFAARGLTVLGLTDWNEQIVVKWVADNGIRYPYGFDKGARLKRQLGIVEWPRFFLVDPAGTIVWEGSWHDLTDAIVQEALDGALTTPVWEWPGDAKTVRIALAKHKYADALTAAAKVSKPEVAQSISEQIHAFIAGRVRAMKSRLDAKDYLRALETANGLSKYLDGLPELAEAKKTLEAIKNDKDSERVIKGQKKVRDIGRSDPKTGKDLDKAIAELEALVKEYSGTAAQKDGTALLGRLRFQKDPTALRKP